MSPKLVAIVEGHGEVKALPHLLRRLIYDAERFDVEIPTPIRVPKSRVVRKGDEIERRELERAIKLAGLKLGSPRDGAILILFDADDACPAILGPKLENLAREVRPDIALSVVLAKCEYEAWFLAALESLRGRQYIRGDAEAPPDPEAVSDAKGYLARQMMPEHSYSPTVDQAILSELFDLAEAARCRSFVKLRKEVLAFLRAFGDGTALHGE